MWGTLFERVASWLERLTKTRSKLVVYATLFFTCFALLLIFLTPLYPSIAKQDLLTILVVSIWIATSTSTLMAGCFVVFDALNGKIVGPPASRLLAIIRFAFPRRAYNAIFLPTVLDYREEHAEALLIGDKWRARYLSALLWWTLLITVLSWLATNVVKRVVSIWKMS